ncbi:MAG TPA: hypothetical protein VN840_03955 [Streptosporangiaceae bacterium]|nr:hypothetical protein [Streptosporangiaceae bacterium]
MMQLLLIGATLVAIPTLGRVVRTLIGLLVRLVVGLLVTGFALLVLVAFMAHGKVL